MRQTGLLLGGLFFLATAWLGPLPELAGSSFAAHMALHLIVIAAAAPLIALGLSGTRVESWLYAVGLLNPILASVAELIVVWLWHLPALHAASRSAAEIFAVEQLSFLGVGFLLWLSALAQTGGADRRAAIGIIGLLLTSMHMALLGALLSLAPRPLYGHHGGMPEAALADQQIGGLLMLAVGGTVYLIAGLWLLARLLKDRPTLAAALPKQ